ncbi:MAG: hypothetical protein DSM107014_00695 [Gomphosphaeria aponina SAG 52.96 = DSM 107014]|uniref:Uncharacterized protein n=1 Tax=Gomphosphaeria aponina SAG 52.96 = DSM 107014 TaxID=1521640 RepID=A0A941GWH1_9CHRO|nr:hypothetical protein [Gomphosphaeria aponina SAG 52.96 = DSM 107014]
MTNSATANSGNFLDWDFLTPQPTQDSELLKQLGFIPGLKEILMLRQVHALEHATVWVLSETEGTQVDNESLGGLSTDQGFYLYGNVNVVEVQRAVKTALSRLKAGEWNLAVHPRCGTNLSVSMVLTAGFSLGAYLLLPRNLVAQLIGLGVAATTAAQLAPDLGMHAQKYLTTSIPFNLEVREIGSGSDFWGRKANFVRVRWQET